MIEEQPKKKVIEIEKEKRYTYPLVTLQNEETGERYEESVSIIGREIFRFEPTTSGTGPSTSAGSLPFATGTTSTSVSGSSLSGSYN